MPVDAAMIADLNRSLGNAAVGDEDLLLRYLSAALAAVQGPPPIGTGRLFEASADSVRHFDARRDIDGRTLYLDVELAAITSVVNGDGQTIPSTEYVTEPRNRTPYYALTLKAGAAYVWQWITNPEDAIAITGKWAYSVTLPSDIREAVIEIAKYYYLHRNEAQGDVVVVPELGTITVPRGIPALAKLILDGYKRRGL